MVRHHIHKCITCFRQRASVAQQLMGNLPPSRVMPTRAFLKSGIDYAGPFIVKSWKGRGAKQYKAYIALFVCLSTKAIHLELVTDLTSAGFLAAFRRFSGRRGHISDLYSDNGTNFIGAKTELAELTALFSKQFSN